MEIQLGNRIQTRTPENVLRSNNGGDYAHFETKVVINGEVAGHLLSTSAGFDYCQISGTFTKTVGVNVAGTNISFEVSQSAGFCNGDSVTVAQFMELLQPTYTPRGRKK